MSFFTDTNFERAEQNQNFSFIFTFIWRGLIWFCPSFIKTTHFCRLNIAKSHWKFLLVPKFTDDILSLFFKFYKFKSTSIGPWLIQVSFYWLLLTIFNDCSQKKWCFFLDKMIYFCSFTFKWLLSSLQLLSKWALDLELTQNMHLHFSHVIFQ